MISYNQSGDDDCEADHGQRLGPLCEENDAASTKDESSRALSFSTSKGIVGTDLRCGAPTESASCRVIAQSMPSLPSALRRHDSSTLAASSAHRSDRSSTVAPASLPTDPPPPDCTPGSTPAVPPQVSSCTPASSSTSSLTASRQGSDLSRQVSNSAQPNALPSEVCNLSELAPMSAPEAAEMSCGAPEQTPEPNNQQSVPPVPAQHRRRMNESVLSIGKEVEDECKELPLTSTIAPSPLPPAKLMAPPKILQRGVLFSVPEAS